MASDWPTEPSSATEPSVTIFLNFLKMIHRNEITVERANQELDSLDGFPAHTRFWGVHTVVDLTSGRASVHSIKWVDGGWQNGTKDHMNDIRNIRTGNTNGIT